MPDRGEAEFHGLLYPDPKGFRLTCSCGSWEKTRPSKEKLYELHAQHMTDRHS